MIEFARKSAHDGAVAGIGMAEPAAREAAEPAVGRDDYDRFAHLFDLYGAGYGRARSAVNYDVVLTFVGRVRTRRGGEEGETAEREQGGG